MNDTLRALKGETSAAYRLWKKLGPTAAGLPLERRLWQEYLTCRQRYRAALSQAAPAPNEASQANGAPPALSQVAV